MNKGKKILLVLVGLVAVILAVVFGGFAYLKSQVNIKIEVKAEDLQMIQEEELPESGWTVTIDDERYRKLPLRLKNYYTVGDLMSDLEQGRYLQIHTDADLTYEGDYEIDASLSEEYDSVPNQFGWKLSTDVQGGTLTVLNKLGTWEGYKFKKWDGTYATNEYIEWKRKEYYLNENGDMAVGFTRIGDDTYYFDGDGQKCTGWVADGEGNWYYFNSEYVMVYDWQEIDGATYYFGEDGKMTTGERQIGMELCYFGEDGTLDYKEKRIDPSTKMIALTFDDGPGKDTDRLLDVLEQYGAHATFFMVGTNVGSRSSTVQRMLNLGCELGNHTWTHPQLTTLSAGGVQDEVGKTNSAIASACGQGATVLRPPYGDVNSSVLSTVGMPAILWSVDTLDWKTKDKDKTVEAIMGAQDGDIVLLHDIHSWSVDAAIEAIPKLIEEGYLLVTVSELAGSRNGGLSIGKSYSQFYPN